MPPAASATASASALLALSDPKLQARYVQDGANLLDAPQRERIVASCREIEEVMRIRVLVRTERVNDLSTYGHEVDTFFNTWIREIDLDKRGILFFAAVPTNAPDGRLNLRVGVGLKYLITREMGEKLLQRFNVPVESGVSQGQSFVEGIAALKRLLVDELKREQEAAVGAQGFSIARILWDAKELLVALVIGLLLCWMIFFIERCPRCNATLKINREVLKKATNHAHGLQRRIYLCGRCGYSRRKKEVLYPAGKAGWMMRLFGDKRNVKVVSLGAGADDRDEADSETGAAPAGVPPGSASSAAQGEGTSGASSVPDAATTASSGRTDPGTHPPE